MLASILRPRFPNAPPLSRLNSSWTLRASPPNPPPPTTPLKDCLPWQAPSHKRGKSSSRPGALCLKVGMTQLWDKWGVLHPVTILHVDRNRILQVKRKEGEGYSSVQVGAGGVKRKNELKPELGHVQGILDREEWSEKALANVKAMGFESKEDGFVPDIIQEFRVHDGAVEMIEESLGEVKGARISAAQFVPGQLIDCVGTSRGKGFQGAMKKWSE